MSHRQRLSRLVMVLCVLAGTLSVPSVRAKDGTPQKGMANPSFQPSTVTTGLISSGGPLTKIYAGNDASSQVGHILEQGTASPYEFYESTTFPADAGTFLTVAGVLYAPRFAEHPVTATSNLGTFTGFGSVSQTAVTGAGTIGDPFKITTVVSLGATGMSISQKDSYVVGQESYRTDVTINNASGQTLSGILYRGIDCYLGGSDSGYGFVTGTSPGCTKTPNNTPPERYIQLQPITAGNNYYEDYYGNVWSAIGTKTPLSNSCACAQSLDNGIAISWPFSLANGASATYSHMTAIVGRAVSRRIADFDGDGITDLTVYNEPSGLWYYRSSITTATTTLGYGGTGYAPVTMDYDGDNKTDIAVFHDASALWFIRQSSNGATVTVGYGGSGYITVPRDYDNDGKADIAMYHEPSGLWFIRQTASANATLTVGYGGPGYAPVPNDYDGDGRADIAAYHPASGTWFIKRSSDGVTTSTAYGGAGQAPVPADYDGDGKVDIALYHEGTGVWSILKSSTGSTVQFAFGGTGLKAVNLPPVYTTP